LADIRGKLGWRELNIVILVKYLPHNLQIVLIELKNVVNLVIGFVLIFVPAHSLQFTKSQTND